MSTVDLPKQITGNLHIFGWYLGTQCIFSKPIFALKPWVWAGWFEYYKPYSLNEFLHIGVRVICQTFTHRKIPQIWFCLFGSFFSILINKFSHYLEYLLQMFVFFTAPQKTPLALIFFKPEGQICRPKI